MTGLVAALAAAWCAMLLTPSVRRRRPASGRRWLRRWFAARSRTRAPDVELAEALELLAGCVEAGLPLRRAVDVVADVMSEEVASSLRQVRCRLDVGMPEAQAWAEAEGELGAVAVDIGRSSQAGTGLTEVLRTHARQLREESHARAVVECRKLGVRAVLPMTICYLPAFLLVGVLPIIASAVWTLLS